MVPVKGWQSLLICREIFPRKFLWHRWLSVAGHRPLTLYVMPLPWKTVAPFLLSPVVIWHDYCPLPRSNPQKEQDGAFSYPGHSQIFWCHQLTSPEEVTPTMQHYLSSTVLSKRDRSDLNLKTFSDFYFSENPVEVDGNFAQAGREGIDCVLADMFSG